MSLLYKFKNLFGKKKPLRKGDLYKLGGLEREINLYASNNVRCKQLVSEYEKQVNILEKSGYEVDAPKNKLRLYKTRLARKRKR